MNLIVSPYHLTTGEVPAMAALLLAEQVVTVMPTGPGGRTQAESLAAAAPRYARLIESWGWSVPLWNAGVLVPGVGDDHPGRDIQAAHAEIFASDAWASLRTVLEERQHESPQGYLEALAHDLLRGGPDPAFCVPVAAGLDRFASRHGAAVLRSAPVSVAQKLEMRAVRPLASVAMPVILQGRGERILDAREVLADELAELRDALGRSAFQADSLGRSALRADSSAQGRSAHRADSSASNQLRAAASRYRSAFESSRFAFDEDDESEPRVITGEVSLRVVEMSSDAALESSNQATRSLMGRSALRADSQSGSALRSDSGRSDSLSPTDSGLTLAPGRTTSIIVRVIGSH